MQLIAINQSILVGYVDTSGGVFAVRYNDQSVLSEESAEMLLFLEATRLLTIEQGTPLDKE